METDLASPIKIRLDDAELESTLNTPLSFSLDVSARFEEWVPVTSQRSASECSNMPHH